jgi:hypothetical protein
LEHIRTLARVGSQSEDADAMRKHFEMILTFVEKALTKKRQKQKPSAERGDSNPLTSTAITLIGFIAWTLALLVLMEIIRTFLVLAGKVSPNGLDPDNGNLSTVMQRLARMPTVSKACRWSEAYWPLQSS